MTTDAYAESSSPPPERGALLEEARRLLARGRVLESERLADEIIEAGGDRSRAEYVAGVARLRRGDLEGAAERFRQAADADAANADALHGLGVVAEAHGAADRAVALYERAIMVDPEHKDALRKLRERRSEAALAARWGVYAYIVSDASPLARNGLRLMESLRRRGRPSLVAYFGRYFVHFLVLGVALVVLVAGGAQAQADAQVSVPWAPIAAGIAAFVVAVFSIRVLTTEIELDKGRLLIERGVLNKRRTSVELWRVRDVELRRPLLNRLTGDGTLILSLSPTGATRMPGRRGRDRIRVTGLLRGKDLRESHQDLLNLVFVLRSNAQVKGIIQ